ncbi:MAG: PQQ-binding-like beta-propeller repeat protein [Deltaproteobacteria bacterium]|nr:PQQ-binding-like beta-propeller repeat protein [Deltaproteobacteria bacterium]
MFRNNLQRTGVFNTKGVLQAPKSIGKFKTGGMIQSSSVVSDGVVYFGSRDGILYALR